MDNAVAAPEVTTDYAQFRLILNNRDTNRGHIETLKRAFEESGNLTQNMPILVNEKMEIIDGQHRFVAAKELDMPVYYTVRPGLGIADARQMNILQKQWDTDDYAHSYADGGDANYRRYLQLREEYGYSHSILMYFINGDDRKGAMSGFRSGEFTLSPEELPEVRARLDHLAEIEEVVPDLARQLEFAKALLKSMNVEEYNKSRMVQKLAGAPEIPKYASVLDYQRALEDIYNRGIQQGNRVRLF